MFSVVLCTTIVCSHNEEEEYLPMMNLGGFGLLILSYYGLYGLDPYIDDFLLNTSHQKLSPTAAQLVLLFSSLSVLLSSL